MTVLAVLAVWGAGFTSGRNWREDREKGTLVTVSTTVSLLAASFAVFLLTAYGLGDAMRTISEAMLALISAFAALTGLGLAGLALMRGTAHLATFAANVNAWRERRRRLRDPHSAEAILARATARVDHLLALMPDEIAWQELRANIVETRDRIIPKYLELRDRLDADLVPLNELEVAYAHESGADASKLVVDFRRRKRAAEDARQQAEHRVENALKFLDVVEADIRLARTGVKAPAPLRHIRDMDQPRRPPPMDDPLRRKIQSRGGAAARSPRFPPPPPPVSPPRNGSYVPDAPTTRAVFIDDGEELTASTTHFRSMKDDFAGDMDALQRAHEELGPNLPGRPRPRGQRSSE